MTRRRRAPHRKNNADNSNSNSNTNSSSNGNDTFSSGVSPRLIQYYSALIPLLSSTRSNGILTENEPLSISQFFEIIQTTLPSAFRLTRMHKSELEYNSYRQQLLDAVKATSAPYSHNDWYPTFSLSIPGGKQFLRENKTLQKLLTRGQELGLLTRQEAVSMIPPLLMQVKAGMKVLDICAAPGSKTTQLIELMEQDSENTENTESNQGFVMANDADGQRAYLLVHQAKRLNNNKFIVTHLDATRFPTIYNGEQERVPFDSILCDVPCSGDGTLRKAPNLTLSWHPQTAIGLHSLQLRILWRALEMTRAGGRVVYSTCSLNPCENEAVLLTTLTRAKGKVRIVNMSEALPGLWRRSGLCQAWPLLVPTGNNEFELMTQSNEITSKNNIPESCFFTENEFTAQLAYSWRLWPTDQNTGGFFVAVLEKMEEFESFSKEESKVEVEVNKVEDNKVSEVNEVEVNEENEVVEQIIEVTTEAPIEQVESMEEQVESIEEQVNQVETAKSNSLPKRFKQQFSPCQKEAPFILLPLHHPLVEELKQFFGIQTMPCLMVRCPVVFDTSFQPKTIYTISDAIAPLLQGKSVSQLNLVNTGIKMFCKNDDPQGAYTRGMACLYRWSQEFLSLPGVQSIYGRLNQVVPSCLNKRWIYLNETRIIQHLLKEPFPRLNELQLDATLLAHISALPMGGCLLFYRIQHQLKVVSCWKGKVSLSILVEKELRMWLLEEVESEMKGNQELETKVQDDNMNME